METPVPLPISDPPVQRAGHRGHRVPRSAVRSCIHHHIGPPTVFCALFPMRRNPIRCLCRLGSRRRGVLCDRSVPHLPELVCRERDHATGAQREEERHAQATVAGENERADKERQ